jgi:membrane fusion protein, multidrug efflux system
MVFRNRRSIRRSWLMYLSLRAAIIAGLAALVGCDAKQPEAAPPPPEVASVTLAEQSVPLTTELPGRTTAYRIAEVRPQVGGIIETRLFAEGADVQANEQLYQIDSRRFAAELDHANASVKRAQAELGRAQYELRRLTNLMKSESAADKEYQDALFAERVADAALDLALSEQRIAALNLEWTVVTAPIAGRIGYSSVTEGALVTGQQISPLTTIQQIDQIYVNVTQSSADLLRLKRQWETGAISAGGEGESTVRLLLEDGTPYPLEGTLQFRDITVDPTTGSYTLRILFPNPQHLLLPGMFVRALVQEGTARQAILVPQQAVSRNAKGEAIALIVDDAGVVQQRKLSLDRALGDRWLVSSGLAAGERVIVEGLQKVRPGVTVKEVPFEADRKAVAQATAVSQSQPSP